MEEDSPIMAEMKKKLHRTRRIMEVGRQQIILIMQQVFSEKFKVERILHLRTRAQITCFRIDFRLIVRLNCR